MHIITRLEIADVVTQGSVRKSGTVARPLTSCHSNGSESPYTDRSSVFTGWRQCAPAFHTWFLEPTQAVCFTTGICIFIVLAGLATPKVTDGPRNVKTCIAIGRIYAKHTMRPNNCNICRIIGAYSCKLRASTLECCGGWQSFVNQLVFVTKPYNHSEVVKL